MSVCGFEFSSKSWYVSSLILHFIQMGGFQELQLSLDESICSVISLLLLLPYGFFPKVFELACKSFLFFCLLVIYFAIMR